MMDLITSLFSGSTATPSGIEQSSSFPFPAEQFQGLKCLSEKWALSSDTRLFTLWAFDTDDRIKNVAKAILKPKSHILCAEMQENLSKFFNGIYIQKNVQDFIQERNLDKQYAEESGYMWGDKQSTEFIALMNKNMTEIEQIEQQGLGVNPRLKPESQKKLRELKLKPILESATALKANMSFIQAIMLHPQRNCLLFDQKIDQFEGVEKTKTHTPKQRFDDFKKWLNFLGVMNKIAIQRKWLPIRSLIFENCHKELSSLSKITDTIAKNIILEVTEGLCLVRDRIEEEFDTVEKAISGDLNQPEYYQTSNLEKMCVKTQKEFVQMLFLKIGILKWTEEHLLESASHLSKCLGCSEK